MKKVRILMYSSYVFVFIILAFGIPLYFGYGNLLPFVEDGMTLADNIWLIVMPLYSFLSYLVFNRKRFLESFQFCSFLVLKSSLFELMEKLYG